MVEPPSLLGAVHVTVAWALPPVAVPMVGAPGAVLAAEIVVLVNTGGGPDSRPLSNVPAAVPVASTAFNGRKVMVGHEPPLTVSPLHGGDVEVAYRDLA